MRAFGHILTLLGPLLGELIYIITVFVIAPPLSYRVAEMFIVVMLFGLPYSYVVGLVPAIVTGVVDYYFERWYSLVVVFLVGAATSSAAIVIYTRDPSVLSTSRAYVLVIAGALSASACHLVVKRYSSRAAS
jgi:uncharacterized membrane protein